VGLRAGLMRPLNYTVIFPLIKVVCEGIQSCVIYPNNGLWKRVTDAPDGLESRGVGDDPLALITRISISTKRKLQQMQVHILPGAWIFVC
jgi:hypothetical protein